MRSRGERDEAASHDRRRGRERAIGLAGPHDVSDETLAWIGDAQFVMLGEASHGTHEFYRFRAELTKRLIAAKGFAAIAVEADFPDAYRVNRYIQRRGKDET